MIGGVCVLPTPRSVKEPGACLAPASSRSLKSKTGSSESFDSNSSEAHFSRTSTTSPGPNAGHTRCVRACGPHCRPHTHTQRQRRHCNWRHEFSAQRSVLISWKWNRLLKMIYLTKIDTYRKQVPYGLRRQWHKSKCARAASQLVV